MKNHQITTPTDTHSQFEFAFVIGLISQTKPARTPKNTERPIIKEVKASQQRKHVGLQFEFPFFQG